MNPDEIYAFYKTNEQAYDYITNRLHQTRESIINAQRMVRQHVLYLADCYAVITVSTNVEAHDLAFASVANHPTDSEAILDDLQNTRARSDGEYAVLYHNNKTEYITHNLRNVDYDRQAELFAEEKWDELHELKIEQVKGIGTTKAAFSMAMCGVVQKACLDGNMLNGFGFDRRAADRVSIEEYDDLVQEMMAETPDLAEELPAYVWQWVVWDYIRDSAVTVHDSWFMTVGDALSDPAIAV